jgi:hypothetical protein
MFFFSLSTVHDLIFQGNSTHSTRVFKLQKRVIRIIMGLGIVTHVESF